MKRMYQSVTNKSRFKSCYILYLCELSKFASSMKVTSCSAFAQTLRRYTSLNHLAQAARAVLQNSSQITQMLADLNRVDFANVQVCMRNSWGCSVDLKHKGTWQMSLLRWEDIIWQFLYF